MRKTRLFRQASVFTTLFLLVPAVTIGSTAELGSPQIVNVMELSSLSVVGHPKFEASYKYLREPNAVVTKDGTLVVVAGPHHVRGRNDRAHQDGLCRTSRDGGKTWTAVELIADAGMDSVLPYTLVYDKERDRVLFVYNVIHNDPDRPKKDKLPCKQFVTHSDDSGASWSQPTEILKGLGAICVFGGGNGFQLEHGPRKGRLIIPGGARKGGYFFSDDHGESWAFEPVQSRGRLEATGCEMSDGTIMLNRRQGGYGMSALFSRDGGRTWSKQREILPDAWSSCNNSALCTTNADGNEVILIGAPLGPKNASKYSVEQDAENRTRGVEDSGQVARSNGAVFVSRDGGQTWPIGVNIAPGWTFGYNVLVALPNGMIGFVFEGSPAGISWANIKRDHNTGARLGIYMAKFSLEWLLSQENSKAVQQRTRTMPKADLVKATQHIKKRPNILLIVGEDHGCELSCYGDPVIETPHIDAFAAQGMLFENGYVTQSVCSPSRSTIFTGLYPHQNGQLGLATHKYAWFKKWPTTYSLLKNAGYRTGLIGKTHIIPPEAVESFVDFRYQKSANFSKRKVAEYAVKAGEFFRSADQPFFMTVNYPDAHWPLQGQVDGLPETQVDADKVQVMPYVGGETPRLRQVAKNYYDCMLRLDACIGQLLGKLEESGKADNTLVIFIGDHGAQMARGKVTVYEGGLRVPFIARWPGVIEPNQRSNALVSTIDLLPTFMDAADAAVPEGLPGHSLNPLFDGATGDHFREFLVCERNCDAAQHTFPQRTIRDSRYKIIYTLAQDRADPAAELYQKNGRAHWEGCLTKEELANASEQTRLGYARWLNPSEVQLYDLQIDPHEWSDLADNPDYAKTMNRLLKALKKWQVTTNDPLRHPDKLRMLMKENDKVAATRKRSPSGGWQYLKYLDPSNN